MNHQLGRSADLLTAIGAVTTLSLGAATALAWPVRHGPVSTTVLVFLLSFAACALAGVHAAEPWIRRAARRRERKARQP